MLVKKSTQAQSAAESKSRLALVSFLGASSNRFAVSSSEFRLDRCTLRLERAVAELWRLQPSYTKNEVGDCVLHFTGTERMVAITGNRDAACHMDAGLLGLEVMLVLPRWNEKFSPPYGLGRHSTCVAPGAIMVTQTP
jgi:hypothetical protein